MDATQAVKQTSYCLDVMVGYEQYRSELITFLREAAASFPIGKLQRGVWNASKTLRIETQNAAGLQDHIIKHFRSNSSKDYVIRDSDCVVPATRVVADLSIWQPDYDSPYGYKPFMLLEVPY